MMKKIITITFSLYMILFISAESFCQDVSLKDAEIIELGKKLNFQSKILDEEREIWIKFPEGYNNSSSDFPVVYLLDGETNFSFTSGLLDQAELRSVPKSILVGIINTNRTRDLRPPKSKIEGNKENTSEKDANDFLLMLEEELIPFVDQNFRTSKFKTLIGHSYGGLFIIHLLTKKPELFDAYIAISPSFWWDDQNVVSAFEEKLKQNPNMKGFLFLSMANEKGTMLGGLMKFVGILESLSPTNLKWEHKIYPKEHHGSVPVISQVEGFQFIYKDWHVPDPYLEYKNFGIDGLKIRSKKIKKTFGVDWNLKDEDYADFLYMLNEDGHYEDQLTLGLQLINNGNKQVEFYESVARSYFALKDNKNAIKYFEEAFKLNPGYGAVNEMLDSLAVDKRRLLKPDNLDRKELEGYVGEYVDEKSTYSVKTVKNALLFNAGDGYLFLSGKLISMGKDKFYMENGHYTFHFFSAHGKDKLNRLTIRGVSGWEKKMIKKN